MKTVVCSGKASVQCNETMRVQTDKASAAATTSIVKDIWEIAKAL